MKMKKYLALLFALSLIPSMAMGQQATIGAMPDPGYILDYSYSLGKDNAVSLNLRMEGFNGFRAETWRGVDVGVRRNAMLFPMRVDGSSRGTIIQELKTEDEGRLILRFVDNENPERAFWLVLAPKETLSTGRVRFFGSAAMITPNLPVFCKSWCLRAEMTCTSGREVTKCCDQNATVIYNDTACSISCTSCPAQGSNP